MIYIYIYIYIWSGWGRESHYYYITKQIINKYRNKLIDMNISTLCFSFLSHFGFVFVFLLYTLSDVLVSFHKMGLVKENNSEATMTNEKLYFYNISLLVSWSLPNASRDFFLMGRRKRKSLNPYWSVPPMPVMKRTSSTSTMSYLTWSDIFPNAML